MARTGTRQSPPRPSGSPRSERWYRIIWRWHFYAGLFCVPFILWLSVTGALYLFKPQIEGWLYAPYAGVAAEGRAMLPPSSIVIDGTAALPGSVLHKYVLADAPGDAVQLLVGKGQAEQRLWIHPQNGAVLKAVPEEDRFMRIVFRLHGELLAGQWGSALIETAACWTIVMILSGLFLWWPRGASAPDGNGVGKTRTRLALGGILWPRFGQGKQRFWRDMHAVTGLWVSLAAIFLILSGLPWARSWGDYLREVRILTGALSGPQDWSAGSEADARARAALDRAARASLAGRREEAGHDGHEGHGGMMMAGPPPSLAALDKVVPAAQVLHLAGPVEIRPPKKPGGAWMVQSQAEDRTLRAAAEIAPDGRLIGVQSFASRHWIDRVVGYGVAIHEGAWLGLANQLFNLTVLLGLVTLALSSIVLWWRRRPKGVLGAPSSKGALRHSWALVGLVLLLALLMPLFGISLAFVTLIEAALRGSRSRAARWLGLRLPA